MDISSAAEKGPEIIVIEDGDDRIPPTMSGDNYLAQQGFISNSGRKGPLCLRANPNVEGSQAANSIIRTTPTIPHGFDNQLVFIRPDLGSEPTFTDWYDSPGTYGHLATSSLSTRDIVNPKALALASQTSSASSLSNSGFPYNQIKIHKEDKTFDLKSTSPKMEIVNEETLPYQEHVSEISDTSSDLSGQIMSTANGDRIWQLSVADSGVIELDGREDLEDRIPDGVEVIFLEDVYTEDSRSKDKQKKTKETKLERRNPSITLPFISLESLTLNKMVLRPNKTIEQCDGGLLRIKDIFYNTQTEEVRIRGHRLQRARHLNGLLEAKVNEVAIFLEIDLDDPRDPLEQGAIEIPVTDVVKVRQARFTNQRFPDCRAFTVGDFKNNIETTELGGLTIRWKYTCKYASAADRYNNVFKERTLERIKFEECLPMYALSDETRRFQWRGETIRGGSYRPMLEGADEQKLPTEEELLDKKMPRTEKHKLSSDVEALQGWPAKKARHDNDETIRTGDSSGVGQIAGTTIIDLSLDDCDMVEAPLPSNSAVTSRTVSPEPQVSPISHSINLDSSELSFPPSSGSIQTTTTGALLPIYRTANQAYTYADAFCGAGGSTRGALLAGLRPKYGFDFNVNACASWRANFPFAQCYNTDAHTLIARASHPSLADPFKVDILHLSPPCQYFSPAHTVFGVDDEQNVASLFAVREVIKVARPRVITLEQTFGIACSRFSWYFNALIQMFTSQDFSVRWAIVPLAQWGLPQRRNRLIIIASCPGEILPSLPLYTHSPNDPSLLPLVSATSVLNSIPLSAADHDPLAPNLQFLPHRQMPPWDGSKILPRAMTTSGGQNYHPSGKRDLTLREYACLQGFPVDHVFKGKGVKKQIGNAVPPCVAKVLFESIRKDLERRDGIVEVFELIE